MAYGVRFDAIHAFPSDDAVGLIRGEALVECSSFLLFLFSLSVAHLHVVFQCVGIHFSPGNKLSGTERSSHLDLQPIFKLLYHHQRSHQIASAPLTSTTHHHHP
jgi:hypothetical protein